MTLGLFGTYKIMQLDFIFQTLVCMRLWGISRFNKLQNSNFNFISKIRKLDLAVL